MRLPFFRPKSDAGSAADRPDRSGDDPAALQLVRTQARRRLIGAVVLLLAAVVGFPLLFETQPRPLLGSVAIDSSGLVIRGEPAGRPPAGETARARSAAPAQLSASAAATGSAKLAAPAAVVTTVPTTVPTAAQASAPADAAAVAASATPAAAVLQTVAKSPAKAASVAASPQAGKVVAAAATAAAPAASTPGKSAVGKKAEAPASAPKTAPANLAKAEAAPAAPAAASAPSDAANVRWVVQVGAYNDMERMRQARQKAEKLGFKTYITDVDTPTGKRTRVRLGPFATKKEAEAAAVKVKANGMAANVLSL